MTYEDKMALEARSRELLRAVEECDKGIAADEEKMSSWKLENVRRKHNYIPFIVKLLKVLASNGKLSALIDNATPRNQRPVEQLHQWACIFIVVGISLLKMYIFVDE